MGLKNSFYSSRRSFLKGATTAGAFGAFAPALLKAGTAKASTSAKGIVSGSHWGAFRATVVDGEWTQITPWEHDPRPSGQLAGVKDAARSTSRVQYPMVRRSYLENGPGAATETRGNGDFVRVSWDEALDLIAKQLQQTKEQHGLSAIYANSMGWKSAGRVNNGRSLLARCLNLCIDGAFVKSHGDYSTGCSQVIMPHVTGGLEVYSAHSAWPTLIENTDTLVLFGSDPLKNSQVASGIADHNAYPYYEAFKKAGKRVISIDPRMTESADFFNAEWIPIRPGTDVALMLGIAHEIYSKGKHDEAFLEDYTEGFDKFLPYLTGERDGTAKTPAWAAEICGVDAAKIVELADIFTSGTTMLAGSWAMQRQEFGEQVHWMLVTLAAMIGQIGLPGGGFGLSYHYSNQGSPAANSPGLPGMSPGRVSEDAAAALKAAGTRAIPIARLADMLETPGGTYDFNGTQGTYPDVKLMYLVGVNMFNQHQDLNRLRKAWQKLDTVIVHEQFWTATARFADIVLPITTTAERNDIDHVGDYSKKAILAMKKVVEPLFEARSDFDAFAGIAERFGKKEEFTEGKDEMAWIRSFYEAAKKQADAKKIPMPDFDTFWETGFVRFEPTEASKNYVTFADYREDPLLEPLGTPSGKIEIYSRNIEKMGYDDCPAHPTWMDPRERLGGKEAAYPLNLLSTHPANRLHSQLNGTSLREVYTVGGREPCYIGKVEAAARGIVDGDVVRLFNGRGEVFAGAVVTDKLSAGVVVLSEGAWYNPVNVLDEKTPCAYGSPNALTADRPSSKLAMATTALSCMVDIEKYAGEAPKPDVFEQPSAS
ncbi:trimethylamine-N-oxide reductase TorA [Polycladidibacter hongkongensis]|uniref:trimethylamine-N-oxide reductase TorA n=1 Tax=Polycladidibacter hongkongensis TaxID=1647556 RepID=UPI00082E1510|nr:trimethylamine-N-oxide reductase TorA [Pseudovibrio hongkongensis]